MTDKLYAPHKLLSLLYLVFLVSVAGAFRAVSSISIGLIIAVSLIRNKKLTGAWFNWNLRNPFFLTCSLFFLLQLIALAYTDNFYEGWKHVQVKSALLFIPLCFYSCGFINKVNFHALMIAFIYMLAAFLTWCLGVSCFKYLFHQAPVTVFFYHQLVSDLGHHAVQFSILAFTGLLYLLHLTTRNTFLVNRPFHFFITAYFITGILLLSSKLVIIFTLAYLTFYLVTRLQKKFNARLAAIIAITVAILCTSGILFTQNPVSRRFNDILHGNIAVIQQPTFNRANYFNGVQFRLLQWRFVKEILHENKAWVFGVTPAAAQPLLNQKYISTHMYTGTPGSADHGYLNYNAHNQFLESLLQTGIVGLFCYFMICFQMVWTAVVTRRQNRLLLPLVLLLLAYSCCDSVFETQYGLVLFLFLPLFLYVGESGSYPPATKG
jgi:O-antigen ligase